MRTLNRSGSKTHPLWYADDGREANKGIVGQTTLKRGTKLRPLVARCFLAVIGAIVLATTLPLTFPAEVFWARTLVTLPRNGCTVWQAVSAVRYTVNHRRLMERLRHESRIVERDAQGYALWSTPRGRYWAPPGEVGHFFILAEMQLEPYGTDKASVKKGDVVIDCGAYLGHFTMDALEAGAGRVILMEPAPMPATCLRRTFSREIASGQVTVLEEGVWESEGRVEFLDDGSASGSVVLARSPWTEPGAAKIGVSVTTIDALVARLKLDRVDFIKMDIEGSEQPALRGAARTLARFKPRLAIAGYHKPGDPAGIPKVVREGNPGYQMVSEGCRLDLDQIRPLTLFFY